MAYPVTPYEENGVRCLVGGFPGADWVRNLRATNDAEPASPAMTNTNAFGSSRLPRSRGFARSFASSMPDPAMSFAR